MYTYCVLTEMTLHDAEFHFVCTVPHQRPYTLEVKGGYMYNCTTLEVNKTDTLEVNGGATIRHYEKISGCCVFGI